MSEEQPQPLMSAPRQSARTQYLRLKKYVSDHIVGWPALSRLGQSKMIRSFNWIFVLAPILATALSSLPDVVEISILGGTIPIVTELPFRVVIFFFCSVAFAAANLLFIVFCPRIVKEFPSYRVFAKEDGSFETLKSFLIDGSIGGSERIRKKLAKRIVSSYCEEDPDRLFYLRTTTISEGLAGANASSNRLPDVFAALYNYASTARPFLRLSCVVLYLLGFVLLGLVLVENMLIVIGERI